MEKGRPSEQRSARAAVRQKQILDAAARCFRLSGFQGTSMTDISVASGMSAGHIYHYFPTKEAIVEAVTARDICRGRTILFDLVCSVFDLPPGDDRSDGLPEPNLVLAAFAEAAHNPAIGSLLSDFAARNLSELGTLMQDERVRAELGPGIDVAEASGMLTSLLHGLMIRMILDPQFKEADLLRVLRRFLGVLRGQDPNPAATQKRPDTP